MTSVEPHAGAWSTASCLPRRLPTRWLGSLGLGLALSLSLVAQVSESFTFVTTREIPDGESAGLREARRLSSEIVRLTSVRVRLVIRGEFNGDLYGYLRHGSGFAVLLNRPGRSTANPAGYDDSGLDVLLHDNAAGGDIHAYRAVVAPRPGQTLAGEWAPDGRSQDPAAVSTDGPRPAMLSSFNKLPAAGDWVLYLADTEAGGTNQLAEWGLELAGSVHPSLRWEPEDLVYGSPLGSNQLNALAMYGGTNLPGTYHYSPPLGTHMDAGTNLTLAVTFTPDDTLTFLPVSTNVSLRVHPAALFVAAANASRRYGKANPPLRCHIAGAKGNDEFSAEALCSALAFSPVGNHAIVPTVKGERLSNYTVILAQGVLQVTPAPLTVAAHDATRRYGSLNPVLGGKVVGLLPGDRLVVTYNASAEPNAAPGSYAIRPFPSGGSASNYAIEVVEGTLTVLPATANVVLTSSVNPAAGDESCVWTASISGSAGNLATPGGKAQFRIDGLATGEPVPVNKGTAVFLAPALPHGTHEVEVTYSGDPRHEGATARLVGGQIINSPPVTVPDRLVRHPGDGARVRLTTLMANDRDPDGDPLTFALVSRSTPKAVLSIEGSWLFYKPARDVDQPDSFDYLVSDGYGGVARGTVEVLVQPELDAGGRLTLIPLGGNRLKIEGRGQPGRDYHLEQTDELSKLQWIDVDGGVGVIGPDGRFEHIDTAPGGVRLRVYRSAEP